MSVTTVPGVFEQAPGDVVALDVPSLVLGAATASLANQLPQGTAPGTADTPIEFTGTIVADENTGNSTFTFQVPDGALDGMLTVTDSAGNTSAQFLRVVPQYVAESEYVGEGQDDIISELASGELVNVLRKASALIDGYLGRTLRVKTFLERHNYEQGQRKFWPYHLPIKAVTSIVFVTANSMKTPFNISTDIYFDPDVRYVDILAFTIGNYELLGMLEHIGFSANVVELTVQAGYPYTSYPPQIRAACAMITTKYLNEVRMNKFGLGGLVQSQQGLMIRDVKNAYVLPKEVKTLLGRFFPRSFR